MLAEYRTLPDAERSPGAESYLIHSLARQLTDEGCYTEAETLFLEAKAIDSKVIPKGHPIWVIRLTNLAYLYYLQKRYQEAEPLLLDTLNIMQMLQETLGKDRYHPNLGGCMGNLANLYESKEDMPRQKLLYLNALAINKKVLPPNHPDLIMKNHGLARLYEAQEHFEKAEPLYLEVITNKRKVLAENHPEVATALNDLAIMYSKQGRFEEAEPLFLEALSIKRKSLSQNHPSLVVGLENLASLYQQQGRLEEATALELEAASLKRETSGKKPLLS